MKRTAWTMRLLAFGTVVSGWGILQPLQAQAPAFSEVCVQFRAACAAPQDSNVVKSFIDAAESYAQGRENRPLESGTVATGRIMLAESKINPLEKYQIFHANRLPIEDAIRRAPENPDLRLFRLSVQWTVPFFLDYHANIDEDAAAVETALASGYWNEDPEHAAFVLTFLEHIRHDHSK